MRKARIILMALFLLGGAMGAFATEPLHSGNAPFIPMSEAITKAETYLKQRNEMPQGYLQSAVFHPFQMATQKRGWTITWQVPDVKGGTTFIDVMEDGSFQVRKGE